MAETVESPVGVRFLDMEPILKIIDEQNRLMGFVPDRTATPQKARQLMLDQGIRPEDNLFSSGIIAARNERGGTLNGRYS